MKITELKCTACNGTLKIDENNPHSAICEYCHTKYIIEDDGNDQVHLNPDFPSDYTPPLQSITPYARQKASGGRLGAVLWVLCIAAVLTLSWWTLSRVRTTDQSNRGISESLFSGAGGNAVEVTPAESFTGVFASMAEQAFGKPAGDLTDEELSKIQWLELHYDFDNVLVGYSFDDPCSTETAVLTWVTFPRDTADINEDQLSRFSGLKVLNSEGYIPETVLKQLSLERLSCHFNTPAELSAILGDKTANMKELTITGVKSLEGLSSFTGLDSLTLEGKDLTDIKDLAAMTWLKDLTLDYCDGITDFSVLSVMTWLQSLSIESENLRDIGFISRMPELTSLAIYDTGVMNLNALSDASGLTSLTVKDCYEMTDCSSVSGLTGLSSLSLDIPYSCEEPDLSGLSQLKELSLSKFQNTSFLSNMTELHTLSLNACQINNPGAFAGLTNLKKLSCSYINDQESWSFINQIPSLEILDLNGITTYEDISGVFRLPAIRELYLNGVECELDFSKLQTNEALTTLEMDGVKLYTNVQISGGGGIYSIDYDDVVLDEHLDFLKYYPGLKRLSLAENKLTSLSFAEGLPALESLNIKENYITDLKPLSSLTALKLVDCTGNPVENYRVLNDTITLLK